MNSILSSYRLICISTLFLISGFTFAQSLPTAVPTNHLDITSREILYFCGITPDYVNLSNLVAHHKADDETQATSIYTNPCDMLSQSPNAVKINMSSNGKFRVFFEDINMNTGDGFADPIYGLDRINTLLASLDYVESVIDVQVSPPADYIDIYIMRSIATYNPATVADNFLARAGPYYAPGTFGFTQGYFDGHVFTHATTGIDPEWCQYDGHIEVNFDSYFDASTSSFFPISYWNNYLNTTQTCRFDLFTVMLHEVTHAMGWLSTVVEDPFTLTAQCGNAANSYSGYDRFFNWYGTPVSPSGFVQVVDPSGPVINSAMSSFTNPLRSNMIWLNNSP